MQRWIQRVGSGVVGCWLAWAGAAEAKTTTSEASRATDPSGQSSAEASDGDSLATLARDLTLTISEDGPNQPWTVTIANRGSEPIGFIADPGLLWLEVTPPGRTAQSCVLPEPLRPARIQRKSFLVLKPGQQYSRRLDPRFFCFAELGQVLLVPGAKVTPHFGWQREVVPPAKGRAATRRPAAPPQPRLVAWRASANGTSASAPTSAPGADEPRGDEPLDEPAPSAASTGWSMPSEGLESLHGASLELPPAYSVWGATPRPGPKSDIELVMLAGSDAEDERSATITFGVLNTLDRPQHIFVRRDLLSYEVQGPDGFFECPGSDVGSPDAASFSTLPAHGAERAVVRLIEVCPRRSFARPGLYEVHARLNARWSGQEAGLDAFVGRLEVSRPAFVRVRSGDRSSFARLVVPPVSGVAPAPGVIPPGQLDTTPAEPGSDPAGAPDEAPGEAEAPHGAETPAVLEVQPAPPAPPPVE